MVSKEIRIPAGLPSEMIEFALRFISAVQSDDIAIGKIVNLDDFATILSELRVPVEMITKAIDAVLSLGIAEKCMAYYDLVTHFVGSGSSVLQSVKLSDFNLRFDDKGLWKNILICL